MFRKMIIFIQAVVALCIANIAAAANPLSLDFNNIDEDADPITLGEQLLAAFGTLVLTILGFIYLVIFIKELIKGYGDAKEDGKYWKLGAIFIVGAAILFVIVYLITLGLGVATG